MLPVPLGVMLVGLHKMFFWPQVNSQKVGYSGCEGRATPVHTNYADGLSNLAPIAWNIESDH